MKQLFSTIVEIDSYGIHHNRPNVKYEQWEINSLGFLGEEIILEKKEGQIRITCLGGSESFWVYGDKGKEWPSQLAGLMNDRFPWIEVINISVIGLHTKKRKEYIEKYVLSLKPDFMVIYHQRFLTYIKDTFRENQFNPRTNQPEREEAKYDVTDFILAKFEAIARRYLFGLFSNNIHRLRQCRKLWIKKRRFLGNKKPLDEVPEHVISEYEKDLILFVDYLKDHNVVPVLSTFPALTSSFNKDIYRHLLMDCRYYYGIELSTDCILDAMDKINNRIRRMAKEQNIILVDNDKWVSKTQEYFFDNFHYTDKGAEAVAKNIFLTLTRHGLLK